MRSGLRSVLEQAQQGGSHHLQNSCRLSNAKQNPCPVGSALWTSTTRLTLSQDISKGEGDGTFSQEGRSERRELEARVLIAALMPNASMPASRILLDISANNSFPNRRMREEMKLALLKALKMPSPHCSMLLQVL